MLPAIYCRLKTKKLQHILPEDLDTYLKDIANINRNRNKAILKQVQVISQLLNLHQIDHVFLKGSALLARGSYSDLAERMVGDIDILIEPSKITTAFELLKANGYDKTSGFAYETKNFRHLDRLISDDELAAIEIHSDLLNLNYRALLDFSSVLASKTISNSIAIPDQYHLSTHQMLSWQINDKGHYYNLPHLKSAYDLIVIEAHKDKTLIARLLNTKYGQSYLELAKYYFKEFSNVPSNNYMKAIRISHKAIASFTALRIMVISVKRMVNYLWIRLLLVLKNPNYTKHLIKMIFLPNKR